MFNPDETIARLHRSHQTVLDRLAGLTDEVVKRDSALPGWTVGHVLTHLARNADAVVRQLEGAARDEVVDQYPGGKAGRAADIEAGAGRGADELVQDVRQSGLAAEQAAASLPPQAWPRFARHVAGGLISAQDLLIGRIREVEVHHVDLGLGYSPSDWPAEFVAETLAVEVPELAERADPALLLGWLTGRGPAPDLPSWR